MNWQHSIVDEPDFKAPWTALNNAIQLAYEVGTSAALTAETFHVGKTHRRQRHVQFADDVHLVIDHEDTHSRFSVSLPEDSLFGWHTKPWALEPHTLAYQKSSLDFHDDPRSTVVLISKACGIDIDSVSFMQLNVPQMACRREPDDHARLTFHDTPLDALLVNVPIHQAQNHAGIGDAPEVHVPDDHSSVSSSSHISQRVCIYHLDDPPVFGRIDWSDYHLMMHEAALLLHINNDDLLSLIDIASPLSDLPNDVVPLIAHIAGDLDPGEPRVLALADLEIHANAHEAHYHTAPVVDRAVYAFPQIADRRSVFQTVDVATYCQLEGQRCLLYRNRQAVVTLGNPRFPVRPGDYVKVVIPPPETCGWSTQRLLQFYRHSDDAQHSSVASSHSGYSPSLVPSDELRHQLGFSSPDDLSLMQTAVVASHNSCARKHARPSQTEDFCRDSRNGTDMQVVHYASSPHLQLVHRQHIDQMSFTEAFLRAVRVLQETADAIQDQNVAAPDIDTYAPWVQDVHELWTRLAVLGPGGAEILGRLETWYTDHDSFQRCYNSRIAVFADDYENWEAQLKLLWRDRIRSDEPIECFLIYPPPDDRAEQTIGQMMIVQRAAAFQRSVLISVYDSDYDQGRAHSHALVMGDRIDLQSVTTMIQAGEDCPPDRPANVWSLWFGTRQFHPHERAFARHGHAFRFLIHRRPLDAPADPLASDSDDLRQRLRAMIGDAPPSPRIEYMISAPSWLQTLQRTFDSFATTEREDEGPVAYVAAWYVNCHRQPRCQPHRTVRLRSDISAWQRTLMEAWRDRLDMRLRTELYWVDPTPQNPPTQNLIGHVLIVQEPRRDHVVVLLSGVAHLGYQDDIHHSAVCIHERQTAPSIVDILPVPSHLRSFNFHVGIGPREFLRDASYRLENGDNIVIDIDVEVPVREDLHPRSETDETNLLQRRPLHRKLPIVDSSGVPDQPVMQNGEVIQLANLLPSPVWTVINCQSIADLRQRLTTFPAPQVCFDLQTTKCTQVTADALQATPFWTFEYPLAFEFYTDGAFNSARSLAAAGVVLIVQTQHGNRFGGYLTSWCATTASAPRAEASAVILAVHWACYLVVALCFSSTPMSLMYDVYAGQAAQGRCASTLNSDLTIVARALTLWLEQLSFCHVSWAHVKGHSDHPWNDLADTVASSALISGHVTTDLAELLQCCLHEGPDQCALSWLWLYEKSARGDGDAPVLHNHQWRFNAAAPLEHMPDFQAQPFERRRVKHQGAHLQAEQICLRFATANVLTLYPQQDHGGSFLGARAEQLAMQFLSAGIHCIGLQETRCGHSGHQSFESFHVLSSSATARGHGGVQFWIANKITMTNRVLNVSHEHLRIVYGDDRRLIVHLRHPQLSLLFLVLHAPCSDDEMELQRWWAQTSNLIPNGYTSWTWVVLCDSNGRLGSVVSNSVGAFGA